MTAQLNTKYGAPEDDPVRAAIESIAEALRVQQEQLDRVGSILADVSSRIAALEPNTAQASAQALQALQTSATAARIVQTHEQRLAGLGNELEGFKVEMAGLYADLTERLESRK